VVNLYGDVTVVIPHIPTRTHLLKRALGSVLSQTQLPEDIVVVTDVNHDGAAVTRNRGLALVKTTYVAFLDDDDYLYSDHIEKCLEHGYGADITYPWFDVVNGTDPLGMFGKPFDPEHLKLSNYIPITVVAKAETLRSVGGFTRHPDTGDNPCEDWHCWLKVHNAGGEITHLAQRTWAWDHATGNTSGRGDRW
jgi:hypothetical protein